MYFREMKVYDYATVDECWAATGKAPIGTRWIDTNKGDKTRPNYRSRLVAKEFRLKPEPELYAATPPVECLRLLLSRLAEDKDQKLLYIDVSRAYFYAKAVRPVYVRLPDEDPRCQEPGVVGRLVMSMYGTRDAACNWSEEYSSKLVEAGYIRGISNPCLFHHPKSGVGIMVHGDDFVAVGNKQGTNELKKVLEHAYKIKAEILGNGIGEVSEVRILNRIIRRSESGICLEADPRHVELAAKTLGLATAKGARLPGSKVDRVVNVKQNEKELADVMGLMQNLKSGKGNGAGDSIKEADISKVEADDESDGEDDPLLVGSEATKFRAVAARLNYLSPDRPDIQYAVKETARRMSAPKTSDWQALRRIVR